MNSKVKHFHWIDYVVFGVFLAASAGIGFVVGLLDRKKSTSKTFLNGGGKMHWIPVALSMQASFLSAIYILAMPVEFYNFGTMYYFMILTHIVALPLAANMFLAIFYRLNLISAYEYLEIRFNRVVRVAGAGTFCLMVILYMSVVLYTPAIALAQVTGLTIDVSILLCGFVCTLYTFIGGMKATIWIDFIQMIIIFLGMASILLLGCIHLGGIGEVWNANDRGGRIIYNEFSLDATKRTTFWTQTVGGMYVSFCLYSSSQTIIQKFLSVKTLRNAHKSIYLDAFTNAISLTLVALVGMTCYAYFETCDPLTSGKINKSDQIIPYLVMELMGEYHGLPGLFIATTASAALSSLSGSLNALSAVTMTDFILPAYLHLTHKHMPERPKAILTRSLILLFGGFAIAAGYVAQYLGDSVLQISISIFGFVGGPLTALVALGICFPCVNCWGALSGLVVSLIVSTWMAMGSIFSNVVPIKLNMRTDGCFANFSYNNLSSFSTTLSSSVLEESQSNYSARVVESEVPWFYRISHFYYGLISLIAAIIVALPISYFTGIPSNTDPQLVYQWRSECCCCCPESCQKSGKYEIDVKIVELPSEEVYANEAFKDQRNKKDTNYSKFEDYKNNILAHHLEMTCAVNNNNYKNGTNNSNGINNNDTTNGNIINNNGNNICHTDNNKSTYNNTHNRLNNKVADKNLQSTKLSSSNSHEDQGPNNINGFNHSSTKNASKKFDRMAQRNTDKGFETKL